MPAKEQRTLDGMFGILGFPEKAFDNDAPKETNFLEKYYCCGLDPKEKTMNNRIRAPSAKPEHMG